MQGTQLLPKKAALILSSLIGISALVPNVGQAEIMDVGSWSGSGCCGDSTRGYVFIAPNSFTINSLDVSTGGTNEAAASLEILQFSSMPPNWVQSTSSFTQLFYQEGSYTATDLNIRIDEGDIIGILGFNGTETPYSNAATPYLTAINGDAVELDRLIYQGLGEATEVSLETGGQMGYILMDYGPGITISDLSSSLISNATALSSLIVSNGVMINGAHSRPLSRRVAEGQKTFWAAGDWGADNHEARDGSVGLLEIGIGHNYGLVQLNLSLGYVGSDQDLVFDGEMEHRGKYVLVEGIVPISGIKGLYATIGAFSQWGDLDTRRGYDTGTIEYSMGSSDSSTWGVRARLDWDNAIAHDSISVSPYVDLWHSHTDVDGYTETGGSLPASYDSKSDSVTDLRIGLNTATQISGSNFDFIANIEAAHRFDSHDAEVTGSVATLGAFDFAGQEYDRTWIKGGLGIEGHVADGKLSIMLNGTTEGEMPNAWLAASYQVNF